MSAVTLRRMTAAEVEAFLAATRPAYAAERAVADHLNDAAALAFAREQHAGMLPQGGDTPGHCFEHIVAASGVVGGVWWYVDASRGEAFIYYLAVDPAQRRRGHARAALAVIESAARAAGCRTLGLNVFTPNAGAIALYERAGFVAVAQYMNLRVA